MISDILAGAPGALTRLPTIISFKTTLTPNLLIREVFVLDAFQIDL